MVDVQFNNILGSSLGIYMKDKPAIPSAQEILQEIKVPGRDGSLITRKKTYESTTIQVNFNYIGKEEQWGNIWRNAKKWLSETNTELCFSDDPTIFYRISHVIVGKNSKRGNRIGDFSANFITKDGLSYLQSGKEEYELTSPFINPGILSKPIYKITGAGVCTITINGVDIIANVVGNLTIDTEKMISYRNDGTSQNTAISGDYEDLYLKSGENTISLTEGFACKIIPRWRCL